MKLPKAVKEAFEEFEIAAVEEGKMMEIVRRELPTPRFGTREALLRADRRYIAAENALFSALNAMRRADRNRRKP